MCFSGTCLQHRLLCSLSQHCCVRGPGIVLCVACVPCCVCGSYVGGCHFKPAGHATPGDLEVAGLESMPSCVRGFLVKEKKRRKNAHHALEKPGGGSTRQCFGAGSRNEVKDCSRQPGEVRAGISIDRSETSFSVLVGTRRCSKYAQPSGKSVYIPVC